MTLHPRIHPGIYVFCTVEKIDTIPTSRIIGSFKEDEAWTVILERNHAAELNLAFDFEAAWITLDILTALDMVGLTALFSNALAQENISCNVIAAFHHDHIFVPKIDAERAVITLNNLTI